MSSTKFKYVLITYQYNNLRIKTIKTPIFMLTELTQV